MAQDCLLRETQLDVEAHTIETHAKFTDLALQVTRGLRTWREVAAIEITFALAVQVCVAETIERCADRSAALAPSGDPGFSERRRESS